MARKVFLQYPCGKIFEIKIPIYIIDGSGNKINILPGSADYFEHAKKKFTINNLKVIEKEVLDQKEDPQKDFISLSRRIRSIE